VDAVTTHPEDGLLWNDAAWRREAESWIAEQVAAAGRWVIESMEEIHVEGWSAVVCGATSGGDLLC
jgi:hypothetical protein